MKYQKTLLSLLVAASFGGASSFAQTAPAADAPAAAADPVSTMTYNVGVVNDYRYRGLSQSGKKPALQFGADYTDKSGLYVGTWNSTIEWIKDTSLSPTAKGPLETDIYGGYRGGITGDLTYDVGVLEYLYATNNLGGISGSTNANTTEVYGSLIYGAAYAKLSDSTSNLFGTQNSKGSTYLDLGYTFDFGNGLTSAVHYGNQTIKAVSPAPLNSVTAYNDYSLGLSKDFDGIVLSGTYITTDYSKRGAHSRYMLPGTGSGTGGRDLGGSGFVVGLKKNF